jgi:hypothetical protein
LPQLVVTMMGCPSELKMMSFFLRMVKLLHFLFNLPSVIALKILELLDYELTPVLN